jgi:hypothetical protein
VFCGLLTNAFGFSGSFEGEIREKRWRRGASGQSGFLWSMNALSADADPAFVGGFVSMSPDAAKSENGMTTKLHCLPQG